jgi:chromosomal replication initiation ATPase DnaA
MLKINIGKHKLEANNIVGIHGNPGTGKSCLMVQIQHRLSLAGIVPVLLDGELMNFLTDETKKGYIQAITALANQCHIILLIDSLELLKNSDMSFYNTLVDKANKGEWNIIYTSQEPAEDFNWNNSILLHTTYNSGFVVEVILPAGYGVVDVTVSSF